MEYKSQKVAFFYFALALLLFLLQVLAGLWLAINYFVTLPQGLVDVVPFSTARAIHTNLLVLWMLLGFMGGTYYIVPVETKREIYSLKIAYLQLVVLALTGFTALVGFIFGWTQEDPCWKSRSPGLGDRRRRPLFCSTWA
jgi:nitric oxide reductase subunit B